MEDGLTVEQLELVDRSYDRIEPRLQPLAMAFFQRLLCEHPALKVIFPRNDVKQHKVAASFFGFVATNLHTAPTLGDLLERMGARGLLEHLSSDDIDVIGRTLLATLAESEGVHWNHDVERGWALACVWTASHLRRGARRRSNSNNPAS